MNAVVHESIFLSKKGIKELKKEISTLERNLTTSLLELRELDKSDSRDGQLVRIEKLSTIETIESDLRDKKLQLSLAKPLPRKRDALKVAIGSVVELIDQQGRLFRYTLVDSIEANPSDGRISILSPLGQNLLGKSVKQSVEWSSRFHTNQLKLVSIR